MKPQPELQPTRLHTILGNTATSGDNPRPCKPTFTGFFSLTNTLATSQHTCHPSTSATRSTTQTNSNARPLRPLCPFYCPVNFGLRGFSTVNKPGAPTYHTSATPPNDQSDIKYSLLQPLRPRRRHGVAGKSSLEH